MPQTSYKYNYPHVIDFFNNVYSYSYVLQDILKLGLLFGSLEGDEASVDEQPEWLTFAHKLFQDFTGGFYISKNKVNVPPHLHFKRYAGDFTHKKCHTK